MSVQSNLAKPERSWTQTDDQRLSFKESESRQKRLFVKTGTLQYFIDIAGFKEFRQKRWVSHRKSNFKIAMLQYFIDTAANTTGLFSLGINLDSLNSKKHNTYIPSNLSLARQARLKRNLTSPCTYFPDVFRLARPGRNLIAEGDFKESRQKSLVIKYGKHNLKTEMLKFFIDMAASTTRLYIINKFLLNLYIRLESLSSRTHTTYVQSRSNRRCMRSNPARPERDLTAERRLYFGLSPNLVRPEERNLTAERRRHCFKRSTNLARLEHILLLTLSLVGTYKESRQKRLVVKTAIIGTDIYFSP